MKKAVALMLGLTLTVGALAGCGNSGTDKTETETKPVQSEAAGDSETAGEGSTEDGLKVALCVTGAKNDMDGASQLMKVFYLWKKSLAVR